MLRRLSVAMVLLACTVLPASAQVGGMVVERHSREPLAGAAVVLLKPDLSEVARTVSGPDGRFAFPDASGGPVVLQAQVLGRLSSLSAAVQPGAAAATDLVLEVPSEEELLAASCGVRSARSSVVVGVVHDAGSGVPLPGAAVKAEWSGSSRTATTDAAGVFRFCDVPVSASLRLEARLIGWSGYEEGQVPDAAVTRADIPILSDPAGVLVRTVGLAVLPAGDTGTVVAGRVLSTEGGTPVGGAVLRIGRTSVPVDDAGRFMVAGVSAGEAELQITHLGFGERSATVYLEPGVRTELELLVAPNPIALNAIEARGDMAARIAARASATPLALFAGARLLEAEERGARVPDLLRTLPGVTVSEGTFATREGVQSGVCVTTNRRINQLVSPGGSSRYPWCESIPLIVDGVLWGEAVGTLRSLNTVDIESIQVLGAMEAQTLFGLRAGGAGGALLIWTRGRGPFASPSRSRN